MQVKWEHDPPLLLTYIPSLTGSWAGRARGHPVMWFMMVQPTVCPLFTHLNFPPWKPQNAPNGYWRPNLFSLCLFPGESADMCKIWWQSVRPFNSVPRFLNFWPPKTPKNTPFGCQMAKYVEPMFIPKWICICVNNLVPICPAVWQLSHNYPFLTP